MTLFLPRALRDQFVCGIRNTSTLKKLLSQDKSFEECVNNAVADEAADKESKGFTSETINYMKDKKRCNKCFRCGEEGHYANKCSMKDSGLKCGYCQKSNHCTKDCFKKKRDEKSKRGVNHIADFEGDEGKDYEFSVPMFVVKTEDVEGNMSGPTHMVNLIRQNS